MKMRKWMSVLLAICMMLSLTPVTALADESGDENAAYAGSVEMREPAQEELANDAPAEPTLDSGDGTVPVVIIDDTTGSEFTQMHGKVTLPGYSYYGDYVLEKYYISRGDTVTISAVPDEGYKVGSLQAFYKTSANAPYRELAVDEATNTFVLPARGPVYVTIHVTFTSIVAYDDYGVSVTVNDGGTGNTVTVDKERANEGELVTVSVNMNPGTRFGGVGLIAHQSGDSAAMVELTQVDETTYTFLMPASDADIYAQFEFVEPDVYSIFFPDDYSPVLNTLIYINGEYQQGIIRDADIQAPNGTGSGSPGDAVRLDIRSGGSYTVTGVVLHYELDGQACEETLEVTPEGSRISSVHTSFTMPAADVSLELILTPFYRVFLTSNWYGSAVLSASEAFAGQEVTLTAQITDPLCSNLFWTSTIYRSSEIVPYTVEQTDEQTFVLKITMPANAVTLGVDFGRTPVPYISRIPNEYRPVVEEEEKELLVYTLLSEAYSGGAATLTDDAYEGWYVLDGTVSYGNNTMLRIDGDVKLVLTDGAALNANNSIYIPEGSSLTVYGQAGDSGTLYAKGYFDESGRAGIICEGELAIIGGQITAIGGRYASGIGCNEGGSCGSVTINGGQVLARGGVVNGHSVTNDNPVEGVGIGGDRGSGVITVNGGSVTAKGGSGAAGIGGNGRTVIINGGTVNASGGNGGHFGAGIGGSDHANGPITINGGTVEAIAANPPQDSYKNAACGAGIGSGGWVSQGGKITINGGNVIATCNGLGAGIGGSAGGSNGTNGHDAGVIEINGADTNVIAMSIYGAGIGGGGTWAGVNEGSGGNGGSITINDGLVFAISSAAGAGIGGGSHGSGGTVTINSGSVIAYGGSSSYSWYDTSTPGTGGAPGGGKDRVNNFLNSYLYSYIADAILDLIFSNTYCGAGIGGGDSGNGGSVTIRGGTMYAVAGGKRANAFGRGDGGSRDGSLTIYSEAMVTYGDFSGSDLNIEGIAEAADRVNKCLTKDFAEIDQCDHQGATYTVTETTHRMQCAHCNTVFYSQDHVLDEQNHCSVCGEWILLGPSDPDDPTPAPVDPTPVPVNPAPGGEIEPDDDNPGGDEPGGDQPGGKQSGGKQSGSKQSGGKQSGGSKASDVPKTGDDSAAGLWIAVLTACCFGVCGTAFGIAKSRKKINE